jgi:hypothetical protein
VLADVKLAQSDDEQLRKNGLNALRVRFGNMKAVNQFFRMHLRARELPEMMTAAKLTHDGAIATYSDLEDKPKAKTPEEAQRLAQQESDANNEE